MVGQDPPLLNGAGGSRPTLLLHLRQIGGSKRGTGRVDRGSAALGPGGRGKVLVPRDPILGTPGHEDFAPATRDPSWRTTLVWFSRDPPYWWRRRTTGTCARRHR